MGNVPSTNADVEYLGDVGVDEKMSDLNPPQQKQNCEREAYCMCPICMENARDREPTVTECGHVFCKICLECAMLYSDKCPICARAIYAEQNCRLYL